MKIAALAVLGLLSTGPLCAQKLGAAAPPELDGPLRERVAAFYEHFRKGEFRQAEQYIDEESKDLFYGAKKNRIINYEIKTIEYADDFRVADVLVSCRTIIPMLGSKPLDVPLSSSWQYAEGNWMLHLNEPEELKQTSFSSPFGSMQFDQNLPEGGRLESQQEQVQPPTIESVKTMYRVSKQGIRFPTSRVGGIQTVEVENRSIGTLKLESFTREIEGLKVTIEKTEIAAGETVKIEIAYDPAVKVLQGRYRLEFMVMPITQRFSVFVDF